MKRPRRYTEKQIEKALQSLDGWRVNKAGTQLTRSFEFDNFVFALAFCAKIAVHAEVLDHHPELHLTYGTVKVKLSTHDVDGLTKLDFDLAKRIDELTTI